ncbi:aconitase family protein, partial [Acinetobacter baumannii]
MTICNMSIEMGARGGMIAPDETTFNYLKGRKFAPTGEQWELKKKEWETLFSDDDAAFDEVLSIDASAIQPM